MCEQGRGVKRKLCPDRTTVTTANELRGQLLGNDMPNKLYETLFLLDPTKVSADAEGVKHQLHTLIERLGGHIEISRPWDYNHKLSYPIGKQKKGSYHAIYYTLESTK